MAGPWLGRRFFARPALEVARDLIGCTLVYERAGERIAGRIVETEAYVGPEDLACHASRGRTKRTDVMFGPAGHAYVYFVYGMYDMLNVVTDRAGHPAAVLIRAVEPEGSISVANASGPGRLCRVFGIDRELDGVDMTAPPLRIARRRGASPRIATSPRIGVDYAGEWAQRPFRFYDADSSAVSGPKAMRE